MPLDWSDRNSTVGDVTYYEQLFYPSVGTIPSARSLSHVTRFAWNDQEEKSLIDPINGLETVRFLWNDNPGNPINTSFPGYIERCRAVNVNNANTSSASVSIVSDSFALIDVGDIRANSPVTFQNSGPFIFDASGAALLPDYYFPDPTHLILSGNSFSDFNMVPVTTEAPTHPRAVVNPYHRYLRQSSLPFVSKGYGGRDSGNSRLVSIYNGEGTSTQFDPFSGQGEPFRPLFNAFELNQVQNPLPNGFGAANGAGPTSTAAYGAAAEVEIGLSTGTSDGGFHATVLPTTVKVEVWLYEYGLVVPNVFVNEMATTLLHTFHVPITSSYTAPGPFGATQLFFTMSPTAVSIPALSDDTTHWKIITLATWEGGDLNGGTPFGRGFVWHKVPCSVKPYATDGCVIGEEIFLPGWLYDPNA